MQKLLLLFFVLLALNVKAQTDLLLLKKRGITQKTFVKGSYIHFKFLIEQWIEGSIKEMRNDSLLVNMFSIRRVPAVSYTHLDVYKRQRYSSQQLSVKIALISYFCKPTKQRLKACLHH